MLTKRRHSRKFWTSGTDKHSRIQSRNQDAWKISIEGRNLRSILMNTLMIMSLSFLIFWCSQFV